MQQFFLSAIISMISFGYASASEMIIYAEGAAVSYVAEYVALDQARARLTASARNQCRALGFESEPVPVENAGSCQASYGSGGRRYWEASCYSEFYCD